VKGQIGVPGTLRHGASNDSGTDLYSPWMIAVTTRHTILSLANLGSDRNLIRAPVADLKTTNGQSADRRHLFLEFVITGWMLMPVRSLRPHTGPGSKCLTQRETLGLIRALSLPQGVDGRLAVARAA
jgi:hypothetical protein